MRHRTRVFPSSAISLPKSAAPELDAQTRNPYSRWRLWIPGSLVPLAPRNGGSTILRARSALDIGRPGLLDQLDHRIRHRNVVEFFGHLAALGESPFEELDGLGGRRLVDGLLVHQDEGRRGNRPGGFAGLVGEDQVVTGGLRPVGIRRGSLEGGYRGLHGLAGLVDQGRVGQLALLGIGILDITDRVLGLADVAGNAFVAFGANAGGPFD